jgi:hypothetical protein
MALYRADEADATRLHRLLAQHGLPVQLERYGRDAAYLVVHSTPLAFPALAKFRGPISAKVPALDKPS